MNVYQKLNQARALFHATQIKKTGHNKFAQYFYFELGDFLVPALSIFNDVGLCATITFDNEIATMRVINIDKPDEVILFTSPMAEANLKGCHPIQNLGAVETYTRRYLWVAALEIVEHDAIDSSEPKKDAAPKKDPTIPARPKTEDLGLDAETIQFIESLVVGVEGMCNDGDAQQALRTYRAAGIEGDMHIAFQNMISSKTRSALRKASEELKAQKQA